MNPDIIRKRIKIAVGEERASLVLKNCKIVNVFTQEITQGDIAVEDGKVAAIGSYSGIYEKDLRGAYVAPGFIDAHVHIESSLVAPAQFAKSVAVHGVTAVIADPHEIANVTGAAGINYMLENSNGLGIDIFVMLPSCVPTSDFETAGAKLEAWELKKLINDPAVLGLGEVMNYPGVVAANDKILEKLAVAANKNIDGHAPKLCGKALAAYAAAEITTDHECTDADELIERLRAGMYVLIREGSAAKNLRELVRGITKENMRRCCFCTDDRHPEDIMTRGSIDNNIRIAVRCGIDPVAAITMATLNPAECYGLKKRGAVAPGYIADFAVIDDLKAFNIIASYKSGILTSENGVYIRDCRESPARNKNTFNIAELNANSFDIRLTGNKANVIELIPFSIVTKKTTATVNIENGLFAGGDDIIKLAVVERHYATGNIGLGLVKGFGLKNAAIASTVAHDSHNVAVIGDNDADMILAVNELKRAMGGITIVSGKKVIKTLALPIAGLMSLLTLEEAAAVMTEMKLIAHELGVSKSYDPFMTLAFMSLPVIPSLKVTDKGLFDVDRFMFTQTQAVD